jgi:hypothetical protein
MTVDRRHHRLGMDEEPVLRGEIGEIAGEGVRNVHEPRDVKSEGEELRFR